MGVPEFLGHPLLVGNDLFALAASDLALHWNPGVESQLMRVHHPLSGLHPDDSPTARFRGYPPAGTPFGWVAGEDTGNRFLALIDGFVSSRWHRDVSWTLGIPASQDGTIYTGFGGHGATRAVMALDATAGAPLWVYPPSDVPGDPFVVEPVKEERTVRQPVPLATGGVGQATRTVSRLLQRPRSLLLPGHWTNGGLVVDGGVIYAEVNNDIVALERSSGALLWRHELERPSVARSLVATPEYLLFCVSPGKTARKPIWEAVHEAGPHALVALRRSDGKEVWRQRMQRPGHVAVAGGLLYYTDGDLRVFGPAERTFELALDSPRTADYGRPAPAEEVGDARQAPPVDGEALADATVVRLTWGEPVPEMLQRVRERRRAAPGYSMLLSLDWLDDTRSGWRGVAAPWLPEARAALVRTAGDLASAAKPEYFDLAPEVNVYLARSPAERETVRELVRSMREAVQRASPGTRVFASFNREVMAGTYGRGAYLPFGRLPTPKPGDGAKMLEVVGDLDLFGLTTAPQSAAATPAQVRLDHLAVPDRELKGKRLVVAGMNLRTDPRDATVPAYMDAVLRACYWLDAPLVALPDAGRVGEGPGRDIWRGVWSRPRVERLSVPSRTGPTAGARRPGGDEKSRLVSGNPVTR